MSSLYEVVTGQILLAKRDQFFSLHRTILLPIMRDIGIRPILMLLTEVGRYGRFLDVYEYNGFAHYDELTSRLLAHPGIDDYYARVGTCIAGSITVELMRSLPYANEANAALLNNRLSNSP